MSCQFGRWNFDGAQTPPTHLDRVRELLSPYGLDGEESYHERGVDLFWFSFETTEPGAQPRTFDSGEVLLWDGRLDNGDALVHEIGDPLSMHASDVEIVAAAWSRWQQNCLIRFIGDWALSLWDPRDRCLLLAADILASRHLCYAVDDAGIQWCSVPDPLVLLPEKEISLDEEYLAGWLAAFPAAHLTPFRAIRRVPPASAVVIRPASCIIRRYWNFDGSRRIRYATDADYEEHFRELLRQSVRRRLRSGSPVLAELSGGMDSASIVCIADRLTSESGSPPIGTVSYYNDSEPHWNERPWFARVEAQRGRAGLHIDVTLPPLSDEVVPGIPLRPGTSTRRSTVVDSMMRNGQRVLLSGIGGDEFLGGVPTPVPELEDLLARGQVMALCRQLFAWALTQRRPWIHVLRDATIGFLPAGLVSQHKLKPFRSWLDPGFMQRQRRVLSGYPRRWELFGPLPSFQENVDALDGICRQLGCKDPSAGYPYEKRYPYLDRDLLEFLFAIPREQLVRPGERRSLMRRALAGIVPDEVLRRKRKAYVSRSLVTTAETKYRDLSPKGTGLRIAVVGMVDSGSFLKTLNDAGQAKDAPMLSLLRAVAVEEWLNALGKTGFTNRFAVAKLSDLRSVHDRRPEPVHPLR